jgi:ABC-type sulfate/molybdate transport systems ATPase subunit
LLLAALGLGAAAMAAGTAAFRRAPTKPSREATISGAALGAQAIVLAALLSARALAMRPKLMPFDEVTSALDPELVKEVLVVMQRLARGGMTLVVVTHEMSFAREVGSRLIFMDEGRVVEEGEPRRVFERPVHPRTRQFLAQVSLDGGTAGAANQLNGEAMPAGSGTAERRASLPPAGPPPPPA